MYLGLLLSKDSLVRVAVTISSESLLGGLLVMSESGSAVPVKVFAREFLEGLALGLGNQESGEDTAKHEESKNLHDVLEPRGVGGTSRSATVNERPEDTLSNDGADFARGSRETVRGGTVASREAFSRHDEGGGIGTEVEEELSQHVESKETVVRVLQWIIGKTNNNEENGKHDKTTKLDRFTAKGINGSHGNPVTRNGTRADENQVADSGVVEDVVYIRAARPTNRRQDDGVVETEAIESNVQEEP